mmetsp:Transcript_78549/g.208506  ORF Transcript_78549/g.208506 Transcript_78549/m.208506 type:complete len:236 (-) Transcript_78549:103-810(-)
MTCFTLFAVAEHLLHLLETRRVVAAELAHVGAADVALCKDHLVAGQCPRLVGEYEANLPHLLHQVGGSRERTLASVGVDHLLVGRQEIAEEQLQHLVDHVQAERHYVVEDDGELQEHDDGMVSSPLGECALTNYGGDRCRHADGEEQDEQPDDDVVQARLHVGELVHTAPHRVLPALGVIPHVGGDADHPGRVPQHAPSGQEVDLPEWAHRSRVGGLALATRVDTTAHVLERGRG